jgi:hypothetical protein
MVFGLTQPLVDVSIEGVNLFLFRIALTISLSEITYQFIEIPIRRGFIEHTINLIKNSNGYEQKKLITAWAFVGCVSLAGCSSLVLATEEKLVAMKTPAINEETLEQTENIYVEETETEQENAATEKSPVENQQPIDKTDTVNKENTLSQSTTQPHLLFDKSKNGKGYVNRVRTINSSGEKTPVFLIGDSVMIGATPELLKQLSYIGIDSQVGRQFDKGIEIIEDLKKKNLLSDVMLIHLGNNSPINPSQLDELLNLLVDTKRIIFVNLKLPRNYESANNKLFDDAANKNSKITIVDWRSNSIKNKSIFAKDGIHLTNKGAKLYASLVTDAILKSNEAVIK